MLPQPNSHRARIVIVASLLFGLATGVQLLVLIMMILIEMDILESQIYAARRYAELLMMMSVPLHGVLIIGTLAWMSRATENLRRIGIQSDYGGIYAGISWFIPIVQLYKPQRIILDLLEKYGRLWRTFIPPDRQREQIDFQREQAWIKLWWLLWLIALPLSFGGAAWLDDAIQDFVGYESWQRIHSYGLGFFKMLLDTALSFAFARVVFRIAYLENCISQLATDGVIDLFLASKRSRLSPPPSKPFSESPPEWYEATTLTVPAAIGEK